MTKTKIRAVLKIYEKELGARNYAKHPYDHKGLFPGNMKALWHVHSMIGKVKVFLKEDRVEKAFRWLGFIQGVLWTAGFYSLEELKNHNRP